MSDETTIAIPSGGDARAFLSLPGGEARVPALLVVHEWWGINDDIRAICDRFASEGIAALAIDLYGGKSTADPAEAMQLVTDMKTADAMQVVAGGLAFLRAHPRCNGNVGVTGFCLGGAMAIAAACTVPGVGAAVPFYGVPKAEFVDFTAPRPPILGHYGAKDGSIPPERVQPVVDQANASGNRFELCMYDAGHAFMRAGDPNAYEPKSAALAWERTIAFLKKELAG